MTTALLILAAADLGKYLVKRRMAKQPWKGPR